MKVKIEAAYYHDNAGNKKPIEINEISKEEYEEKYKGHLTCINNCKARIRFTQKTNGTKFFSTWNHEGELHDLDCPYHVAYKGKNGRSKLKEYYHGIKIDDDIIARRLKDWMSKFHAKQNDGYVEKSDKYNTKTISEDKEGLVDKFYINSAATSREEIGNGVHHGTVANGVHHGTVAKL
ncbi:hypothetical protein DWY02_13625, partial [Eubacterium sp. AF22-9]